MHVSSIQHIIYVWLLRLMRSACARVPLEMFGLRRLAIRNSNPDRYSEIEVLSESGQRRDGGGWWMKCDSVVSVWGRSPSSSVCEWTPAWCWWTRAPATTPPTPLHPTPQKKKVMSQEVGEWAPLSFYSKDSLGDEGNYNRDDDSTCGGHPSRSIVSGSSAGGRGNRPLIGRCRIPPDDVTEHVGELLSVELEKRLSFTSFTCWCWAAFMLFLLAPDIIFIEVLCSWEMWEISSFCGNASPHWPWASMLFTRVRNIKRFKTI